MCRWIRPLLFALLSGLVLPAHAADSIILTVKAAGCCANKGEQTFTLAQLDALPQTTVTTTTPWTNGKHSYQGVRLNVLLDQLGITANTIKATALNAYWAKLRRCSLYVLFRILTPPDNQDFALLGSWL